MVTDLMKALEKYFNRYLVNDRGISPKTIETYRYAFIQLVDYLESQKHIKPEYIKVNDINVNNIEDFLLPSIREFTKPLFSIPTHQFLFNAGQINPKEYMDALQIEPSEFELFRYPERGTCLYRCGNERYLLEVIAPEYKAELFGKGGGR